MSSKRSSSAPQIFADQLDLFITRAAAGKWDKRYSVDIPALTADLKAQVSEKKEDQQKTQEYRQRHKQFMAAQAVRYRRFMTSLRVVREAHRDDPVVSASLEVFKRPATRSRKTTQPTPTPASPTTP